MFICGNVAGQTITTGKFHALIIGNNDYKGEFGVWQDLQTPGENAEALATVLRENYRFDNIELVRNASKKEMLLAFEKLGNKLAKNDSVIVYYAGHAKKVSGEVYWIPIDAKGKRKKTYISTRDIRDLIDELSSEAAHILLISDAPFERNLVDGISNPGGALTVNRSFLAELSAAKSVQAIIQKSGSYVDQDYRKSGTTPLTYNILKILRESTADILTFEELANKTYRGLGSNQQSRLIYGVLKGTNDDTGEFLFVKHRGSQTTAAKKKDTSPKRKVYSAKLYNKRPILPISKF
jgi:hypothetical protein